MSNRQPQNVLPKGLNEYMHLRWFPRHNFYQYWKQLYVPYPSGFKWQKQNIHTGWWNFATKDRPEGTKTRGQSHCHQWAHTSGQDLQRAPTHCSSASSTTANHANHWKKAMETVWYVYKKGIQYYPTNIYDVMKLFDQYSIKGRHCTCTSNIHLKPNMCQ